MFKKIVLTLIISVFTVGVAIAEGLDRNKEAAIDALQIRATMAIDEYQKAVDFLNMFESFGFQTAWTGSDGTEYPAGGNPIIADDIAGSDYAHLSAADIQAAYQELKKFKLWYESGTAPPVLYRVKRK